MTLKEIWKMHCEMNFFSKVAIVGFLLMVGFAVVFGAVHG